MCPSLHYIPLRVLPSLPNLFLISLPPTPSNPFHISVPQSLSRFLPSPNLQSLSYQNIFQLISPPFRVTVPPSLTSLSHLPPFLIIFTFLYLNPFLSLLYISISISFTPSISFTFPSLILSHFPPTLD